jgi:hypothetical protein
MNDFWSESLLRCVLPNGYFLMGFIHAEVMCGVPHTQNIAVLVTQRVDPVGRSFTNHGTEDGPLGYGVGAGPATPLVESFLNQTICVVSVRRHET